MKLFIIISCFISLAFSSDVIELTEADFVAKMETYGTSLVEFYAPWCGHCKKLIPEYEKAASILVKNDPPVTLVKVDCPANDELCKKFGVSGYPTLKIFNGAEVGSDYNGGRTSDGIVSYMKKQVSPASKELATVEDYEKFLKEKTVPVVVGLFSSADDDDSKVFLKFTGSNRDDYTFAHSYSADVSKKVGQSGAVVLVRPASHHNKFEADTEALTESISDANVKSFLEKNFLGLCAEMTSDNEGKFKKPVLTAYYDVDYTLSAKNTNYWRNGVMKVGKEYKDDLFLSIAKADDFSRQMQDLGLEYAKGGVPVVIVKDDQDKKYVMEKDETVTDRKQFMVALETFIKAYLAGKIAPKIKSEPVPTQDGPVTVVVGENFEEVVMDENKDVLIEFYAPWCGHCKSLAPKWDELGEKMKANSDLVIAKIDATANDSPSQFAVSGFPTIYWAPKNGKKSPTKYNGGREVADFVSFLEKNRDKLEKTEL